jgi:hypothetical protein
MRAWAIEPAVNPSVVRVHVAEQLTDRTIVTTPPATVPMPIAGVLELEDVRTVDLHRYHLRVNLRAAADRVRTASSTAEVLAAGWGRPAALPPDAGPKAFAVRHDDPRTVAESAEMANGHPLLEALFAVDGVSEAIAGDGLVLVRLGRLFSWPEREADVRDALATARASR